MFVLLHGIVAGGIEVEFLGGIVTGNESSRLTMQKYEKMLHSFFEHFFLPLAS